MMLQLNLRRLFSLTFAGLLLSTFTCFALQPPEPGMLDRMRREGTLDEAQEFAKSLGLHQPKMPRLGTGSTSMLNADPQTIADDIAAHLGQQIGRDISKIASSTQAELDWTRLDLNRDQIVDERDVLALGFEGPKETAAFPSLGTVKTFALLIDFPNYPHWFQQPQIDTQMFGDGDGSSDLGSLHKYYDYSSGGALNITGETYGWHTASHTRDYYHPDDSQSYPDQGAKQVELVQEAILAADAAGADFSQFDNDGDGVIDTFLVIWSGPNGDWASFWWGYFGVGLPWDFVVDGVHFSSYSWQWELGYGFNDTPPEPTSWNPNVVCHETGHALGIPDYYDYDDAIGPKGGVGGMDMMGATGGDHGPFSKYWLGWLQPTLTDRNLLDERLDMAGSTRDAVLAVPGFDPVAPWSEYFMVQYRAKQGFDWWYPNDGLLIWHCDCRVNAGGGFRYNNSYTDHKLLKLEQADGLDEIELGQGGGDAEDYFLPGNVFSDASYPSSRLYDGTVTNLSVEDIQANGDHMTADFILYSSQPPSVDITAPNPGDTVSGNTMVSVTATDDGSIARLELLIDGERVAETTNGTLDYDWNTLVDFNKPLNLVARAWDNEGQSGSATIGVTVSNAGLASYSDNFSSGLAQWRAINPPLETRGQQTEWTTRVSPADPPPPGGSEGWVKPDNNDDWHGCNDALRGQRINTAAFTRPLHVKFMYRTRGPLLLEYTADNGSSWVRVGTVPPTNEWRSHNILVDVPQGAIYLRLSYTGDVLGNNAAALGASIDDMLVRQAPSGAPSVTIVSPAPGAVLSGDAVFTASPTDDSGIAKVDWYVMDGPAHTSNAAPWEYTRNTLDDDNHPAVRIKAIAEDVDGLPSLPAEITVVFRNPRNYPVFDDIEAGTDAWAFQNYDGAQEWQETTSDAFSPTHAIGLLGPWSQNNVDGLWYSGPPVPAGRRCIDLSGPTVTTPELTFKLNGQVNDGGGVAVYAYTTWAGFNWLGDIGNTAGWEPATFSLEKFIGQSVVITWWHWGNSPNGNGLWMDDIRVDNMAPRIDSISTGNILPGDVVTIKGTGFGATRGSSNVTFTSGVSGTNYVSWSNNEIQVQVPNSVQSGDVFVTVDDIQSNAVVLTLSGFVVTFAGLDPLKYYLPADTETLSVTDLPPDTETCDLLVDGVVVDTSATYPFSDLAVDFAQTTNGAHNASVAAHRAGFTATSNLLPFNVFSLLGDIDGSGALDAADVAALQPLIPLGGFEPAYRPWYDTNLDGRVREDDAAYIGYHFGESL